MKIYKAIFKSQSVINTLPNSQTIFGAICTILSQTQGEQALNEYIGSFDHNAMFIHSSMFLNNSLPMIKRNLFSLDDINELVNTSTNSEKLELLEKTKKYKKISFISEKIFDTYIAENKIEILKRDLLQNPNHFSLDYSVLSFKEETSFVEGASTILTRNGFAESGVDKTLFYTPSIYYPKETEFCIYLKTDQSIKYVENIFKYFEYFGIGNRRSVGMNCFKLEAIETISLPSSKENQLVLSRYIPNKNEVDFKKSYYQLSSDIYRSAKEYTGGFVNGKFIHILEGSWMNILEQKDYYGRIIETEINGKKVYHYAIGFLV